MSEPDLEALASLATEQVRPELGRLDQMAVDQLVALMCADARRATDVVVAAGPAIARAVEAIVERLERGGRLIYVGAGTAGRLGVLDASEAGPTFNVRPGQVMAILAGGTAAFSEPAEDAEDDAAAAAAALDEIGVAESDAVVGVSASGLTPYVLGAVDWARARHALTVGVACNAGSPLCARGDLAIELPVGPEVIAGSTRLNAGTAQKIVLNILSTATMVRLGKTYGNLMVDVRATNEKLRDRASRIVAEITGASPAQARETLQSANWETKVAVLMLAGEIDAPNARARLRGAHDRLRPALEELVRARETGPSE
ncbi:MAG: N-acetylmuramic acid 6-phosphate etherase [Candidatus Limnocylindrales bacterium]